MDDGDRDAMIVEQRLAGRSVPAIAKQYGCSSSEVEAAIDRRLSYYQLDNNMRLRAIKLDVARLDALMVPFYVRALSQQDVQAGTLCVKILERRALLLGLDSPTRVDVVQLQTTEQPSSYEKITAAITRIAHRRNGDGRAAPARSNSEPLATADGPARDTDASASTPRPMPTSST